MCRSGGRGRRGRKLLRDTHASKTDPEARLFRSSQAAESRPSYLEHVFTENRNGLGVAAGSHPECGPHDLLRCETAMGRLFPSAVQIIEKDLDSLLTFFQFDPTYWTVLRTTNPIERLNKEFKRRTNAMEVTGGEISTYRSWPM